MARLRFPGPITAAFLLLVSACSPKPAPPSPTASPPAPTAVPGTLDGTHLPTAEAAPTADVPEEQASPEGCLIPGGRIETYQIAWQGETLAGRIYLPPCYDQEPDRSYPTLYMLHGATETDQEWDLLGIDEVADRLIDQGRIPPLLIVMPREITWRSVAENPFGDQLAQVVIPWVERHYRALPDRQQRAVGGMSRGGNWAVRLGLLHWGLFGSLGGHSTPLFYGDLKRVPGWLEAIPSDMMPRIYLDIGEGDNNLEQAQAFYQALIKAGVDPDWHLYPGLHNEEYWKSHLEEYLLWYSAGWLDD